MKNLTRRRFGKTLASTAADCPCYLLSSTLCTCTNGFARFATVPAELRLGLRDRRLPN